MKNLLLGRMKPSKKYGGQPEYERGKCAAQYTDRYLLVMRAATTNTPRANGKRRRRAIGLRDGKAAAAEFQKFVDRRGHVLSDPLGALARLGLTRANALQGKVSQGKGRVSRLPQSLERSRPRHPHPEGSQSRIREATVRPVMRGGNSPSARGSGLVPLLTNPCGPRLGSSRYQYQPLAVGIRLLRLLAGF